MLAGNGKGAAPAAGAGVGGVVAGGDQAGWGQCDGDSQELLVEPESLRDVCEEELAALPQILFRIQWD